MLDQFIDALVKIPAFVGTLIRPMQSGNLSAALRWMALGVLVLLVCALLRFWS
ncbi:hypothetical protein HBZS_100420 [Helicobacter bizzozeronii CCUG 35545]|nr:hypothetical protein HBZS_100420 [Helicobacter bizzozeronii CCUG 35545]